MDWLSGDEQGEEETGFDEQSLCIASNSSVRWFSS
jgi:hypothetical protein